MARADERTCAVCARPLAPAGARGRVAVVCSEDRPGPFVALPRLTCGMLLRLGGEAAGPAGDGRGIYDDSDNPDQLVAGVMPSLLTVHVQRATRTMRSAVRAAGNRHGLHVPGEPAPDRRR